MTHHIGNRTGPAAPAAPAPAAVLSGLKRQLARPARASLRAQLAKTAIEAPNSALSHICPGD